MSVIDRESVRAVLLSPDWSVLLLRVSSRAGDPGIWIMPGGGCEAGESPEETLHRELREELGCEVQAIGPTLWVWVNTIRRPMESFIERERALLVETARFDPSHDGMTEEERQRTCEWRWWSGAEIAASNEMFVPARLGALLESLQREGPPASPVEVEGLRWR